MDINAELLRRAPKGFLRYDAEDSKDVTNMLPSIVACFRARGFEVELVEAYPLGADIPRTQILISWF
jgi:hypothetical protein